MRIAFNGPFGCGKTTLSEYLNDVYLFDTLSFGYYVRESLVQMGIPYEVAFAEDKDDKLRSLLQCVGEGLRQYDPDFWVKKLLHEATYYVDQEEPCSVDDMRYENEAVALQAAGFKLVRIHCPDCLRDMNPRRYHPSEVDLDDWDEWDGVIHSNLGDVDSLFTQLDELIEKWEREE